MKQLALGLSLSLLCATSYAEQVVCSGKNDLEIKMTLASENGVSGAAAGTLFGYQEKNESIAFNGGFTTMVRTGFTLSASGVSSSGEALKLTVHGNGTGPSTNMNGWLSTAEGILSEKTLALTCSYID